MTDNEIIKAFECCIDNTKDCSECVFLGTEIKEFTTCHVKMIKNALDLINRQKAEIEKLEKELKDSTEFYKIAAIKEFAERLKEESSFECDVSLGYGRPCYEDAVPIIVIDNLVKEMTEGV